MQSSLHLLLVQGIFYLQLSFIFIKIKGGFKSWNLMQLEERKLNAFIIIFRTSCLSQLKIHKVGRNLGIQQSLQCCEETLKRYIYLV